MGSSRRWLLNQSTHSRVAISTASKDFHGPRRLDHLSLVQAVNRLGQSIVVGISHTADGRLDAGQCQALGVFDRDILRASVAVVDQSTPEWTALMQGLVQRVQD